MIINCVLHENKKRCVKIDHDLQNNKAICDQYKWKKKLIMNPRKYDSDDAYLNSRETKPKREFFIFIFSNHLNTIEVCDHK